MQRNITRAAGSLLCVCTLLLAVGGCAGVADSLPADLGGLPAGTPQRTAAPPAYPAVYNVPQRQTAPLTDAEQLRLEQELAAVRARQEALKDPNVQKRGEAAASAMERAKAAAQKKPSAPNPQ